MNDRNRRITNQGKSLLQWIKPTRRMLKGCTLFILLSIVAGWFYVQFYVSFYFEPYLVRSIGEEEYERMKAFLNQTLDFPEEYITGVPLSPKLKRAYENLDRINDSILSNRPSGRGRDLIGELISSWPQYNDKKTGEREFFLTSLQAIDPYLKAGIQLADTIDSEVSRLSPGDLLPLYDRIDWRRNKLQSTFLIKAAFLIQRDRFDEAFDYYAACFPLLLECPYQEFVQYLHCYQLSQTTKQTESIIPNVSSVESLRNGLQRLNRLEPFFFQNISTQQNELILISLVRECERRYRGKFDVAPGMECAKYIHQIATFRHPRMNFFHSFPCIWQWLLAGRKPMMDEIVGMLRPLSLSSAPNHYFYSKIYGNYHAPLTQNKEEDSLEYDILRLKIAARLYELETGKKVAATIDLVPKYFSKEIKERPSGPSYKWTENGDLLGY